MSDADSVEAWAHPRSYYPRTARVGLRHRTWPTHAHFTKAAVKTASPNKRCIMDTLNIHGTFGLYTRTKLLIRATSRRRSALRLLLLTKRHSTQLIHKRTSLLNTTRNAAIARRNIHTRITYEEVARSQQQRHGLSRHNRKVFRRWEMRDAECVPQHDIGVVEVLVGVGFDPGGYALGWLARCLRNVTACWVELCVIVYDKSVKGSVYNLSKILTLRDMYRMPCETSALPYQTSRLW